MIESPYLTREQAAEYLGFSDPKTVSRLPIARAKIGRELRFDRKDLDNYIESLKRVPGQLPAKRSGTGKLSRAKHLKVPSIDGGFRDRLFNAG